MMCLKFVVSLVFFCFFCLRSSLCVGCLLIGFSSWRLVVLDVYVTLLRMRGPHDGVRLYVPGLCPLVVSVLSGLAVFSVVYSWCVVAFFVLPIKRVW